MNSYYSQQETNNNNNTQEEFTDISLSQLETRSHLPFSKEDPIDAYMAFYLNEYTLVTLFIIYYFN